MERLFQKFGEYFAVSSARQELTMNESNTRIVKNGKRQASSQPQMIGSLTCFPMWFRIAFVHLTIVNHGIFQQRLQHLGDEAKR